MSWFMVDIEADGPCPGLYSMVQFGAVLIDKEGKLDKIFYGELFPISDKFEESALKSFNCSREKTLKYESALIVMKKFNEWVEQNNTSYRPMFISDNNGFDWQFINYYFWKFLDKNPFGFSSTNLGSLFKGLEKNFNVNFKYLRKTAHDHNPVNDAKGNAEAFLTLIKKYNIKISI